MSIARGPGFLESILMPSPRQGISLHSSSLGSSPMTTRNVQNSASFLFGKRVSMRQLELSLCLSPRVFGYKAGWSPAGPAVTRKPVYSNRLEREVRSDVDTIGSESSVLLIVIHEARRAKPDRADLFPADRR